MLCRVVNRGRVGTLCRSRVKGDADIAAHTDYGQHRCQSVVMREQASQLDTIVSPLHRLMSEYRNS